jgi:hypothetical protein
LTSSDVRRNVGVVCFPFFETVFDYNTSCDSGVDGWCYVKSTIFADSRFLSFFDIKKYILVISSFKIGGTKNAFIYMVYASMCSD